MIMSPKFLHGANIADLAPMTMLGEVDFISLYSSKRSDRLSFE